VDSAGHRVMLSIAVSGNYNKGMQWHRPENCYPSQGFLIDGATVPIEITTPLVTIAASQLVARRGRRVEPITYWFILGDQQARFGFDLRWHQVLYGLSGTIPDGLLVRVSSIDADAQHAFSVQQSFSRDLVTSIEEKERHRFLGDLAKLSGRAAGG
jgi:EpsI family protein